MKNLGKQAEDIASGFKGTITAACVYLYGSTDYLVTDRVKEGGKMNQEWINESRLKIGDQI